MTHLFCYWLNRFKTWRNTYDTGGTALEHICHSYSFCLEENGEYIVSGGGGYCYRTDTIKQAYRAVRELLVDELRMFRECYVDDAPDYKGRN